MFYDFINMTKSVTKSNSISHYRSENSALTIFSLYFDNQHVSSCFFSGLFCLWNPTFNVIIAWSINTICLLCRPTVIRSLKIICFMSTCLLIFLLDLFIFLFLDTFKVKLIVYVVEWVFKINQFQIIFFWYVTVNFKWLIWK